MTIATGIAKQLRYKKETTWGVAPTVLTGAQLLRRVTSNLALNKAAYVSTELRSDYQVDDYRHGIRSVGGTISGILSPGTYGDFFASVLRSTWSAPTPVATTGALTTNNVPPNVVRTSGSFITDGYKVGDVVRFAGFGQGTANNNKNFLITAMTGTGLTGVFLNGDPMIVNNTVDSGTMALAGKKTWTQQVVHTDDSYTFEHWHTDVLQSEVFLGVKISSLDIGLPPTGLATIALNAMGKDITTGTAAFFTTPNPETTLGTLAAVNGALYMNGAKVALITGLTMKINGNMTADPVVGQNTYPQIFEGRVDVNGQLTALFQDGALRDMFLNETEGSLIAVFTTGNGPTDDFLAFSIPRLKTGGAAKDDGDKGLVQTIPFQALFNKFGGPTTATEITTLVVQDSTQT